MLNRTLVIGLGGSAETLVRYLNLYLERDLRGLGWTSGIPAGWRWLCLDIAQDSDVVTGDVPRSLGDTGTRVGLARNPYEYPTYFEKLAENTKALPGLVGCLPDPDVELPPPFLGAGQRPQVGHVVGLAELGNIGDAIQREITALQSQEAVDQLTALSRRLNVIPPGRPGARVFVISSLCGGSGAGLVQPVVELLLGRATTGSEWLRHELVTILFTPDVFADLTPMERDGVSANALYTTSTMMSGYEATGPAPTALTDLLRTGGSTLIANRRAAATNFFVGSANGEIAFEHQHLTIKATAKAIARMMLDEQVSNGLRAHLDTNRSGATVTSGFRIVDPTATSRQASSLGYANISLGGAVIEEYASERLAREALKTLQRGHSRLAVAGEREDTTIDRLVEERTDWFIQAAGLSDEAVLGSLRNRELLRGEIKEHARKIQGEIRQGDRRDRPDHWLVRIEQEISEVRRQIEDAGRANAAQNWSEAIVGTLRNATAQSVARYGIPVTVGLLEAARVHAKERAGELRRIRTEQLVTKADDREASAHRELASIATDRLIHNRDHVLEVTIDAGCQALFLRFDAEDHQLAADLLQEVDGAVLTPLLHTVGKAKEELAASELRYHRELVASWSTGALPPRLLPTPNERPLEPLDTIPGLVDELLEQTLGADGVGEAVSVAVAELLTGTWRSRESASQTLITCPQKWRAGQGITVTAAFAFTVLEAETLLARAQEWTQQRPGALSDRLRLPIAEWITGAPDRPEQLADALDRALRCAEPLTRINPAVHMRVYGTAPEPPKLFVSTLPIPEGHRVRRRMEQSLLTAGIPDGAVAELFDPTSAAHTIEVSGFTAQPMHPVVLDGLFVPIQRDWDARIDEGMRGRFSAYRRTCPLPQFVPLSPERQLRFVKGWLAARLLGQLTLSDAVGGTRALSVRTPSRPLLLPRVPPRRGHAEGHGRAARARTGVAAARADALRVPRMGGARRIHADPRPGRRDHAGHMDRIRAGAELGQWCRWRAGTSRGGHLRGAPGKAAQRAVGDREALADAPGGARADARERAHDAVVVGDRRAGAGSDRRSAIHNRQGRREPQRTAMNVLLLPDTEPAAGMARRLQQWSEVGLLEPCCVWMASHPATDTVRRIVGGAVDELALDAAIAHVERSATRFLACCPVADGESVTEAFPEAVAAFLASANEGVLAFDEATPLTCTMAVIPASAATSIPPWMFRARWSGLLVAPEDRARSDLPNRLQGDAERFVSHAAHAAATIAALWVVRDDNRADPTAYLQGERTGTLAVGVRVVRCFSRVVELGHIADHVAEAAFTARDGWPQPDPEQFEQPEDPERVIAWLTDGFMDHHSTTLHRRPFEPVREDPPRQLTLLEALRELRDRFLAWAAQQPVELLEEATAAIYDQVVDYIQRLAGTSSNIHILHWGQAPEEERGLDRLRARVEKAGPLTIEDGAVSATWRDLRLLTLGIVDGSRLPDYLDGSALKHGGRRYVTAIRRVLQAIPGQPTRRWRRPRCPCSSRFASVWPAR